MARSAGNAGASPRQRAIRRPCSGAAWVQPRGCKGRSPLHKNSLKSPPSPEGKGGRGMGERKHTKGKVGRRQSRQAPCRVQQPRAATPGEFFRPEQVPAEVPSMIHSGKVLRGSGDSFKSPPAFLRRPPAFFFLHRKKKLAISGRMCSNKHTSGAAGTGGASSRKAEGKEEPS